MSKELFHDLRAVFTKHGHPSYEEPGWAAMTRLLVLNLELTERLMATMDDVEKKQTDLGTALIALGAAIDALKAAKAGAPTDQAAIDAVAATADANLAAVAGLQTKATNP